MFLGRTGYRSTIVVYNVYQTNWAKILGSMHFEIFWGDGVKLLGRYIPVPPCFGTLDGMPYVLYTICTVYVT